MKHNIRYQPATSIVPNLTFRDLKRGAIFRFENDAGRFWMKISLGLISLQRYAVAALDLSDGTWMDVTPDHPVVPLDPGDRIIITT